MSWLLPLPPAADLSGFDLRLHVFPARPEVTQRGGPALLIITSHFPVLRNALFFFFSLRNVLFLQHTQVQPISAGCLFS